jgi:hypothetical protein
MKKALSFAVALGLVAGMASYAAAATVDFHGDARWRGVNESNVDGSELPNVVPADDIADRTGMDQRYRLVANVTVNEDLMIGTRINLRDTMFANSFLGANLGDPDVPNGASTAMVDRAYMKIKMLGGTYLIGRQNASWGNKFLGWGNGTDRIKGVYKSGDLTYGGYLQQDRDDGDNNDKDTFGAFFIGKAGDSKWGVLPNYIVDHGPNAAASGKDTGMLIDGFFNTKIGAVNIMTELVFTGGDMLESVNGDAKIGGFVGASTNMGAMTVKGLVAFYMNNEGDNGKGRDCDNDFAPSLLIGTCQESAIIDFGGTTGKSTIDPVTLVSDDLGDDSTYLIGAGVDLKLNDKLTVGGLVGYLMASENMGWGAAAQNEVTLTEVDLTASYVLAKGVTYKAGIAYGLWDGRSATDDDLLSFSNNIAVKF